MILRHIKISELTALVSSAEYATWKHVPVSPARAYSQSLNPNAQPDDIALIIALDDEDKDILGFIGAYPSKVQKPEVTRFVWLSCWWVTEKVRGQGIAMILFNSFLAVWGKKVAFSDSTEKTFRIIEKLGFCRAMKREGVVLDLLLGITNRLRILNYSKKDFRFIAKLALFSGIPWFADQAANLLLYFPKRLQLGISESLKPIKLKIPEEKDFEFIKRNGVDNFHIPEAEELKMPVWLENPSMENKFLSEKYFFSSFACNFETFWLRWETKGKTHALVMLSLRDGVLKTLYIYCENGFSDKLPEALLNYCFAHSRIRTIVTAQPILTKYISNRKFFIFSRKNFTRYTAVSNELIKYFDQEPILQDGDGDYRFT